MPRNPIDPGSDTAPEEPASTEAEAGGQQARLHGELLMTSLLAFLKSANAYGYELAQRMTEAGLPPFDTAAMYRTLRQLEASGFVASVWDTSESGPARRVYSLTAAGDLFLASWAGMMKSYQAVLDSAFAPFMPPQPPPEDTQKPEA